MENSGLLSLSEYSNYLGRVEDCLKGCQFETIHDIELDAGACVSLAASRTHFLWKGILVISEHVLIAELEHPSIADLNTLFEAGFKYAKKRNRIPLVRGLQFSYMIIPCIVSNAVDHKLIEFVEGQHKRHWARFEFPVVHDLGTKKTHYFQQTEAWGRFYFPEALSIVSKCIEQIAAMS